MNRKKKILSCIGIILVGILIIGEITMRMYGFCNAPLYKDNEYTNYTLQENQNTTRFRNKYITNEYSMRSLPLQDGEYRITFFGDSVINGGAYTDHQLLATTLLENNLDSEFNSKKIRVLNVSCGGWGIDNCAGVIKEFGDFNSKLIVLALNSHDAIGSIALDDIAGTNKNFPDKQYSIAWIELIDRYLIPKIKSKMNLNKKDNSTNTTNGQNVSEGWGFFENYSKENNIPLIIYLHATKLEMQEGKYDENGQWIIKFAAENNIQLITDIEVIKEEDYRDNIHLTAKGQQVIYKNLYSILENSISDSKLE